MRYWGTEQKDVFVIFQLLGLCHSCPLSYLCVILFSFLQAQNQLAIIRQTVAVHLIDMKCFIETLIIMTLGKCTGNWVVAVSNGSVGPGEPTTGEAKAEILINECKPIAPCLDALWLWNRREGQTIVIWPPKMLHTTCMPPKSLREGW